MDVDPVDPRSTQPGVYAGSSSSSAEYCDVPLINEWRYEMRRESQQVIPHLYLGPFQTSVSLEKLQAIAVTHILCVRDKKEAALIYPRFPQHFQYLTLDISDNTGQNVITIFPQCKVFLDNALNSGGTVLVHCNGGISTSPAIVIGYLMSKFGWTYEYALSYVQSRRYCVSPISFQIQLKEYQPITIAERMLAEARKLGQMNGNGDGFGNGERGNGYANVSGTNGGMDARLNKRNVEDE